VHRCTGAQVHRCTGAHTGAQVRGILRPGPPLQCLAHVLRLHLGRCRSLDWCRSAAPPSAMPGRAAAAWRGAPRRLHAPSVLVSQRLASLGPGPDPATGPQSVSGTGRGNDRRTCMAHSGTEASVTRRCRATAQPYLLRCLHQHIQGFKQHPLEIFAGLGGTRKQQALCK
jgi:hypothetical protein